MDHTTGAGILMLLIFCGLGYALAGPIGVIASVLLYLWLAGQN